MCNNKRRKDRGRNQAAHPQENKPRRRRHSVFVEMAGETHRKRAMKGRWHGSSKRAAAAAAPGHGAAGGAPTGAPGRSGHVRSRIRRCRASPCAQEGGRHNGEDGEGPMRRDRNPADTFLVPTLVCPSCCSRPPMGNQGAHWVEPTVALSHHIPGGGHRGPKGPGRRKGRHPRGGWRVGRGMATRTRGERGHTRGGAWAGISVKPGSSWAARAALRPSGP